MNIAVLGAGSWGTALSYVLINNGHNVNLWTRNRTDLDFMKTHGENGKYLPGVKLDHNINYFYDPCEAVEQSDIILISVASQAVRSVLETTSKCIRKDQIIVNVTKGVEISTLKRISEVVEEFCPANRFVALSGPSHAEEVSAQIPTTLVSASTSREAAELIQDVFSNENLRIYTNPDVVGVELGGALKNIIALGAGISDGLGFGDNAKAALITRGIYEIARLGAKMGASENTFKGLTGIGDLIVTCTSMHSRNRRCGILIGQGMASEDAVKEIGMVVEGFYTIKSAYQLSQKYEVSMPITCELYKVIYEDYNAKESVKNLMMRRRTHEMEELAEKFEDWK